MESKTLLTLADDVPEHCIAIGPGDLRLADGI
jgi:hypothetical protein